MNGLKTKIRFQSVNPKKPNTATAKRYENYKSAKTIQEYKNLGGRLDDLKFAFCRGNVIIDGTQAVYMIRQATPILRRFLMPSTTATVARIVAEETGKEQHTLNRVLRAKVQMVSSKVERCEDISSQEGSNIEKDVASSEEGIRVRKASIEVIGNTASSEEGVSSRLGKAPSEEGISGKENDLDDTSTLLAKELLEKLNLSEDKLGEIRQHMKKAMKAEEDTAFASEENEMMSDEDRDIMRGLGINSHQNVWSTVTTKDLIARASAKICQVLVDIENVIRTKEGRPIKSDIEEVKKAAMECLLDPDNEECFNHSERYKALFHRINAVSVPLKDAMKCLEGENGWENPLVDEWKRIFVDMPSIEPLEELPDDVVTVPLLWVLVQKQSALGHDSRKKARIVAAETVGKHFYEKDITISPTVNADAVKVMAAIGLEYNCTFETKDVAGGLLHARYPKDLKPVYVTMPPKLREVLKNHPDLLPRTPSGKVAKYFSISRALYGCRASSRLYYQMFRDFMTGSSVKAKDGHFGAEWSQSQIDACVFFKRRGRGFAILCCHVDDSFLVASPDEDGQRIRHEFNEAFCKRFDLSQECTTGDEHEYLSMLINIDRKKGTLTFRMPKLYKKLKAALESMGDRAKRRGRFCTREKLVKGEPQVVESVDTDLKVRTPMALDHRDIFEPASLEEGNSIVPYEEFDSRKLLGLAAFIILHIRPDSAHCAAIIARFTGCKQTENVIRHVVRLCWYLVDSEEEAVLTYVRGVGDPQLSCMVDASFANDPITKKSYFGYVIMLGQNAVAWKSKLESCVALSTRDSELMAAVHAVRHVLGMMLSNRLGR